MVTGFSALSVNLPSNSIGHLDGDLHLPAWLQRDRAGRDVDRTAAFRLADDLALLVVRLQQDLERLAEREHVRALDREVDHGQPRRNPLRAVLVGRA